MPNCHRHTTLATWLFYIFISHLVISDITDSSCNQGCNCSITPNKYEYQCPDFTATLKNNKDLRIICGLNKSISHTNTDIVNLSSSSIQKLAISQCPVEISLNNLTILTNDIQILLNSLSNLNDLEINLGQIQLTGRLFESNSSLKKINLAQNGLKMVPPNAFENLTNLISLDLSNNGIQDLHDAVFLGLRSLRYLNLQKNRLTEISSTLFYDLQNLEEIDLSKNAIIGIHIEAYQRLVSLAVVNLSYNFVEFDGFSPFYSNLNLKKIDLSHNRIFRVVNDLVINKIYLEELNLSFNKINNIELSNLLPVSHGLKIHLQNNIITSINFTNAHLLEQMNMLDNNDLSPKYYPVTTINLDNNPLICDCTVYDFIKFINSKSTSMQFQINGAKCAWPPLLNGLSLIKLKLYLLTCELEDNNCPTACRCDYRQWDDTIIVDCIKKNLTVAPDLRMVTDNSNQKMEVYLQENMLTNGPREQMGYDNVTALNISQNKIQNIAWLPPNLESLEMEYNDITHLGHNILLQLKSPNLRHLILGNNPWKCDCSAEPFNSFLITELASKQIDVHKIQCSDNQKLLVNQNSQDLCPLATSNLPVIALVISLLIFGLSLFIIIAICNFKKEAPLKRSPRI